MIVFPGKRTTASEGEQQQRLSDGLAELAESALNAKVQLVLEPLNRKYGGMRGHPEMLGKDTQFCLDVIDDVPSLLLAFDVYHSVVMGENPAELIRQRGKNIGISHFAGIMPGDGRMCPGCTSNDRVHPSTRNIPSRSHRNAPAQRRDLPGPGRRRTVAKSVRAPSDV